ncbi:MAG: hypothetical protein V2A73_04760, partial [Pseudomonadota bacterium]
AFARTSVVATLRAAIVPAVMKARVSAVVAKIAQATAMLVVTTASRMAAQIAPSDSSARQ